MTADRSIDLADVRADGWFDRVVGGVPAIERLCDGVGVPLVALSLVAGYRITQAALDRTSGEVETLTWVRDAADGSEREASGTPSALRAEVLTVLVGDGDVPLGELTSDRPDDLREYIGRRYVMLAPLFGLTLRTLLVADSQEPRVVVQHQQVEEIVPVRMLRRFLRARVIDALQAERSKAVSIDLEQIPTVRKAFAAEKFDEVVTKIGGWVHPLMVYLRTPEGAALDGRVRGEIANALSILGESLSRLARKDESEEALRLAVQYAQEGSVAADVYRTLARVMIAEGRAAEAIGPLRRALALDPERHELLLELAACFITARRTVAALGCVREARGKGVADAAVAAVERRIRTELGEAAEKFDTLVGRT